MFEEKREKINGREARVLTGLADYDLYDTLECGQCFRYEPVTREEGYTEYVIMHRGVLFDVAQRERGELIFYGIGDEEFESLAVPFFSLNTDFAAIRRDIVGRTDSEWLIRASEAGSGIAILKQDPWEALLSFIISQNNNIPRIRGMIKKLAARYGVNVSLQNEGKKCPLSKEGCTPCEEKCRECGVCYTFPSAEDIMAEPEGMKVSNPGFRYKYMLDAAEKVSTGAVRLDMIAAARSYTHTRECLMQIKGVGEKVASCVALFGFANLEAFPIDVWMKRAIDEYFGGHLDHEALGRYAGVAQQYIFHYIRNLSEKK